MTRKLIRREIAPPRADLKTFATGERVRLSALGLERCPRMRGYFGQIIGRTGNSYFVVFDGFKTKNRLHASYLSSDDVAAREV